MRKNYESKRKELEMEITISKEALKEIDYIIEHFVENFRDKVTDIGTLAFCLQTLMEGKEKLEEQINV